MKTKINRRLIRREQSRFREIDGCKCASTMKALFPAEFDELINLRMLVNNYGRNREIVGIPLPACDAIMRSIMETSCRASSNMCGALG